MPGHRVNITVDGIPVTVVAGSNLLGALKEAGVEVPHFCYHHALSISGNCRLCKVKVEGVHKLVIACTATAKEGMKISTHRTSQEVADEQKATLEFLLINHPLDCTICDRAGQCKLQDYYLKYGGAVSNSSVSGSVVSRFEEKKETSVKAEVLGNEVIYDGERCVTCTRCIRFCSEITRTSELGMFNRGDRSVVGIFPGRPLENPFSGTVCDLCPVGALTHRRWRFKARIWTAAGRIKMVCPGCSTGCMVEVAVKDNEVVQVIASENSDQMMLCDEGRYGFSRFQPTERLVLPMAHGAFNYEVCAESKLADRFAKLKATQNDDSGKENAMFISPFLTKDEILAAIDFADKVLKLFVSDDNLVINPFVRQISDLEKILVSPDYAPNIKIAGICGMVPQELSGDAAAGFLEKRYKNLLKKVRTKKISKLVVVGDYAVRSGDIDQALVSGALACDMSIQIGTRTVQPETAQQVVSANGEVALGTRAFCEVLLPSKTVLEKSGVFINGGGLERDLNPLFAAPFGCLGESEWLGKIMVAV